MPQRLPPRPGPLPATSAGQFDLFGKPREPEPREPEPREPERDPEQPEPPRRDPAPPEPPRDDPPAREPPEREPPARTPPMRDPANPSEPPPAQARAIASAREALTAQPRRPSSQAELSAQLAQVAPRRFSNEWPQRETASASFDSRAAQQPAALPTPTTPRPPSPPSGEKGERAPAAPRASWDSQLPRAAHAPLREPPEPQLPARGPHAAQVPQRGLAAQGPRVYRVRELTREIKGVLGGRFTDVRVRGEISNLKPSGAGHFYFTLKDEDACLGAVLFRNEARRLKFKLQNGQSLIARGHLDVYEAKGEYQLVCETVEPVGAGALQIAFEQLKSRLAAEGLFAHERKRKLPFLPKRIAVVTSTQGAAVHDFLRVLHRRFPNLPVLIVPARVQGEGAAQEIARGIVRAAQQRSVEIVVVARGGGSLEDLQAFNEEVVARALAQCPVPTVSAVGHETDVTIADLCADVRAPTPTAAAELIAREKHELEDGLRERKMRLMRAMKAQLERRQAQLEKARGRIADPRRLVSERRLRLDKLASRAEDALKLQLAQRKARLAKTREQLDRQHPRERLHRLHRDAARLEEKLKALAERALSRERERLSKSAARLDALSPLKVLARGYAVAFDEAGKALTSADGISPGERLRIRLHEGELRAQVLERDAQTE